MDLHFCCKSSKLSFVFNKSILAVPSPHKGQINWFLSKLLKSKNGEQAEQRQWEQVKMMQSDSSLHFSLQEQQYLADSIGYVGLKGLSFGFLDIFYYNFL